MLKLGDEHGRHTVQRGTALLLHRLQRWSCLEAFAGHHHSGAMGHTREIGEHHAEAVIERDGDAEAVALRELHALAGEEAVVEDVMVRERRPLRHAGGAGRILDVDHVVDIEFGLPAVYLLIRNPGPQREEIVPRVDAGMLRRLHQDGGSEQGQLLGLQLARLRPQRFGADRVEHANVVGRLEPLDEEQRAGLGVAQRVLKLMGTIGRIDVHEHRADDGGAELHKDPLGVVRCPDGYAVATRYAQRDERFRDTTAFVSQLRVGPAAARRHVNKRLVRRNAGNDAVETIGNGRSNEGSERNPVCVAQRLRASHDCLPSLCHCDVLLSYERGAQEQDSRGQRHHIYLSSTSGTSTEPSACW